MGVSDNEVTMKVASRWPLRRGRRSIILSIIGMKPMGGGGGVGQAAALRRAGLQGDWGELAYT